MCMRTSLSPRSRDIGKEMAEGGTINFIPSRYNLVIDKTYVVHDPQIY